ncbi:mechanosensitive ion channel domain-containing protein [Mobilicoccus sp.]|uniref:mechanosensitive ion channel family protein n=1 Tax=Mobilicoccus sp. TaxID=2034349 RepID=UPI0028993898|nr:mechanosensitive ion channel domain-containing protein [Mobilicoccus sp.]
MNTPNPNPLGMPQVTAENVVYALIALTIALVLAVVVRHLVKAVLRWRGRGPSSAEVFARLSSWALVFVGIGAALTVLFPSVRPVDILGGVGVVSIAAGIAFQTVLGNMFAGIVILAHDRFRVGDQIQVEDHRGQIMSMRLSSTTIRTFDGRLLVVPNSVLHSEIVTVQTGFEAVRSSVPLSLDIEGDPTEACRVAVEAMTGLGEVMEDPAPQALLDGVEAGSVRLELRFWSGARQLETREARHAVIRAVLTALHEHDIALGSDSITLEPGPVLTDLVLGTAPGAASTGMTRRDLADRRRRGRM